MDAWMVAKPQSPVSDASDDILQRNGGYNSATGETHIKWTRFVKTGDSHDVIFTNAVMKTSWALHSTSTGMVRHTSTGKGPSLNFLSAGYATGEYGVLPSQPVVSDGGSSSSNSTCSLQTGYSQSILTQWVNSADYPTANYKLVANYGTSDSLKLYWKVLTNPNDANVPIIEFGLIATGIYGYASIGFNHGTNSGMDTADTMFGYVDSSGNPVILDTYMQGNLQAPTLDSSQDFISKNGGLRSVSGNYELHLKWTRLVNTKDSLDHLFTNAQISISWAIAKTSTSMEYVHNYRGKNVMINFLQTATLAHLAAPPGSELATCGSSTGNIKDGSISMNSLTKLANSYRWHLIATAFICGLLVIGGFLLSVIGPRVNPNLFLDLILYRRLTKQVNLKFIGIYINTILDLTLGEAVVISCYWILVAIWFAFGYVNATSAEAGKAFASVCVFNFGLILFPVTRYSVLQVLFGISFDRAIKYHRWLGILQWFFVTAHGIAMVVHYNASGLYLVDVTSPTFPILGIIAWFFMTILWLMTFPVIRRKLWEVFLISHVILSILIVILSIIHGSGYINLLPYMALSILLYLFDVFLRVVFGFGIPTKIDSIKYDEKSQVTTITMRKPFLTFGSNPSMGHFIFLYIPAVSKYQHHPITVSSCKEIDGGMIKKKELEFTVHVKNFGSGWSKQVAKIAQEKAQSANELICRVEGAYGSLSVPLLRYKTIVMFGGGIGITPVHSIYSHLLEKNIQDKTVYTCWSIPTTDMIQVFPQLLETNGNKNLKPNIFISKMKEENSQQTAFIHKGRANPKQFLEQVKKEMKERGELNAYVGVLVCGPEQLVTSVSNAIWDANERNGIRFHLHKEVFTW
ncbi:predicted protein [Naegleria gruberi]|uniref:Predicted protein n=1 Tax=Naegleria gruberi TaxID=5762 RepID=D2W1C6_NAEGR|nr:uncharacterized protein NAEGRDRAFT_75169 [Naegleria gruberi]EFC37202.1 predicted protein [Naegleria gruberi]|eukprot:XP_002669946.1 predicted protein [Naegleria gruberi strain NEG-M]